MKISFLAQFCFIFATCVKVKDSSKDESISRKWKESTAPSLPRAVAEAIAEAAAEGVDRPDVRVINFILEGFPKESVSNTTAETETDTCSECQMKQTFRGVNHVKVSPKDCAIIEGGQKEGIFGLEIDYQSERNSSGDPPTDDIDKIHSQRVSLEFGLRPRARMFRGPTKRKLENSNQNAEFQASVTTAAVETLGVVASKASEENEEPPKKKKQGKKKKAVDVAKGEGNVNSEGQVDSDSTLNASPEEVAPDIAEPKETAMLKKLREELKMHDTDDI